MLLTPHPLCHKLSHLLGPLPLERDVLYGRPRRGRTKTNPDKTPGQPPRQKPPRTIEIEFVQGTFVRNFCRPTRSAKNRGSEMCDVLSGWFPGCVTKCDRG